MSVVSKAFVRRFEDKTSLRVSLHLMVTTFRNMALGLVLILGGSNLLTDSLHDSFRSVDPEYLGGLLLTSGALGVIAWWMQRTLWCRISLVLADVVLILCTVSAIVSLIGNDPVQAWLPVLLVAAIAHDLILVDSPFVDSGSGQTGVIHNDFD